MHEIDWTWCPRVAAHEITRIFLLSQARLQKARQTLEAYGRDLDDLLEATASRPLSDLIKFKALQRRAYQVDGKPAQRLALSWSPDELLATPENIRRQRIPNPRNLDHGWWQKLTWAAATLSAKDLSANHAAYLPLVYYRAVGLLWVTGARRSDEIRRLKVGCVSREWAAQMRDEEGKQLEPEEDLCYVRVPVNKLQILGTYPYLHG